MPFSAASRIVSRRLHATHSGGCGFCIGLGITLRGGICTYLPSTPVNGVSAMQRTATSSPSSHCSRFSSGLTPKPASSASLDDSPLPNSTPTADEVEHADAFGGARRMVELRRGQDDAVAEAHVLGALAARRQEHLGRRRVAVLLEEVVLDLPHVLDAERVGQLDLVERVLDQLVFGAVVPGPADLVLVEDAELHVSRPPRRPHRPSDRCARRG